MEQVTPSPAEAAALAKNATELQAYYVGEMLPQVARRWVWWNSIAMRARAYDVDMDVLFGPELVEHNHRLNDEALRIAARMVMLAGGQLQVQPWSVATEKGPLLRMAFVARERFDNRPAQYSPLHGPWWTGHRHALSGRLGALPAILLGAWALAPGLWTFAVRAIVGTGVFVVADAWATGRAAEMEAAKLYESTRAKAMDTIAQVSKTDPGAGALLADALNKSVLEANRDPVGDLMSAVTEGIRNLTSAGASNIIPILGLWWFFTQRKAS